jgi:hypothetical protein
MKAGDILLHADFTFQGGTKGKKLLIVLNNPDPDQRELYLVILTTSRFKGKQMVPGCIAAWKLFHVPATEGEYFLKPTLLQLDDIYEIDAASAVRNGLAGDLKHVSNLSALTLAQLKNCIKQIKEDVSEKHYRLIFRK